MEKVQWNSINKKQNGLNNRKIKNHPPFPLHVEKKIEQFNMRVIGNKFNCDNNGLNTGG